jgi:DNA-binding transcriptional ArsR family regulator
MRDEPVTIVDREVLKVLSTDTRMDILKILAEGKRNPSFVAKKLKKSDATIVEHLKVMESAGLVKKTTAPGKKWVFYSLTERGVGIVSSKSRRLVIILSSSVIGVIAGVGMLGSSLYSAGMSKGEMLARGVQEAAPAAAADAALGAGEAGAILAQIPWTMYVGAAVLLISIVGIGFYFYKKSKMEKTKI